MNIFESALKFLTDNKEVIGMILGFIFMVAKAGSNEKAGPILHKVQATVDMVSKLVSGLGSVLKMLSDMLANAIKSDGILGKK